MDRFHIRYRSPRVPRLTSRAAIAALLSIALVSLGPAPFVPVAEASSTWVVDTSNRSEAEVRAVWEQLKPVYTGPAYEQTPSWTAPYAPGALRSEFLADGINTLNFARYLAGLPYDVVLDGTRNVDAQHGAVLLRASTFSHTPPKPADMTQAFYDRALASTSSSNIGSGYSDAESFQLACLRDADASNIVRIGHRRWLLNPPMKVTGIGFVDNRLTTYVFDRSRAQVVDYSSIAWPSAGAFPVELFRPDTPWSITLNPARYDWDSTGHRVTLRRVSDGRTWTFDASDTNTGGEYFNADFSGRGVGNAFIFRPDPRGVSYSAGDAFDVTLSGGIYLEGTRTPTTVTHRTRLVSLSGEPTEPEPDPGDPPLPVAEGVLEDCAAHVTFDRFVTGYSASYSGGSYVYGRWSGTSLEARFTGTKIGWYGPKQPGYGKADVYIDGGYAGTVDQYASPGAEKLDALIWQSGTLTDAPHTVSIRLRGEKNPSSSGNVVVVDRFLVEGSDVRCGARLDENGAHGTFTGGWVPSRNPTYLGGGYAYSYWSGSSYRATFTGTKVAWIGPRTAGYGRADVYVDGVWQRTVSQYGPTGWRYRLWESKTLSPGTNTIEIRILGTKDTASTGTIVVIDALDVTP